MVQDTTPKDGKIIISDNASKIQKNMDGHTASENSGEWTTVTAQRKSPRNAPRLHVDTTTAKNDNDKGDKGRKRQKDITPRSSGKEVNKRSNITVAVKQEMIDEDVPQVTQDPKDVVTVDMTNDDDTDVEHFVDAIPFSGDEASDTEATVEVVENDTIDNSSVTVEKAADNDVTDDVVTTVPAPTETVTEKQG